MSKARLQEIRERLEAATLGPWKMVPRNLFFYKKANGNDYVEDPSKFTNEHALSEEAQNGDFLGANISGPPEPGRATFLVRDAWFIANARDDIEYLLSLVEKSTDP